MKLTFRKKWTFWQRYRRVVLFFGIPMVCLEFIGVPIFGWRIVLAVAVPAMLVGLLIYTVIEHLLISALAEGYKSE